MQALRRVHPPAAGGCCRVLILELWPMAGFTWMQRIAPNRERGMGCLLPRLHLPVKASCARLLRPLRTRRLCQRAPGCGASRHNTGRPMRPPSEHMLMMRPPPWLRMRGRTALIMRTTSSRFVFTCSMNAANDVCSSAPYRSEPALATSASNCPAWPAQAGQCNSLQRARSGCPGRSFLRRRANLA